MITNGNVNPAANGVPGLYIQINRPPAAPLPGAPSDIIGMVGTASWGPVNLPVAFSDEAGGSAIFSPMAARKFDLMTQVHTAGMNGGRNFRGVRVTDGTDTAASVVVQTNGGTATAKYTGTRGAGVKLTIGPGTKASTKKVTITLPGAPTETFDNIAASAASNASWVAIAAAINLGINGQPASNLIVFTAGASTTAPANATVTLSGGADGAGIAQSDLVGSDASPRTGMYALRNTGAALMVLADCDDSTTWAAQRAYGISEGTYPIACSPSGDTISNFQSVMDSTGSDDPWLKVLFGDWLYMLDGVNGNIPRLVSPQGFYAGMKASIGPHQSGLNKVIQGVVGSQKSQANAVYSNAELQLIGQARGDVITNTPAGGNYFGAAFGRNASSDAARRQETYTTMVDYLAASLNEAAGLGQFVGRLITPAESREAKSAIGAFLQGEWDAGRIGNAAGTLPYSVEIDNSQALIGVQKAIVQVQLLAVIEFFLVDLSAGTTVVITQQQAVAA